MVNRMLAALQRGLSHKSGLVRKGCIALLRAPRWWSSFAARREQYLARPVIFANSFPKSGTHLVNQIVDGLPYGQNFGTFLASMTSSFQFRERSVENSVACIRAFVPGEIVRGHLFYDPKYVGELRERNSVHYFIYRDPRDVVVSEAHYYRDINRWHRLHRRFREVPAMEDAITLAIEGFRPPIPGICYPNVAERFARYEGWLQCEECLAIRFEDLISERRPQVIHAMAQWYAARTSLPLELEPCIAAMTASIAPEKSHTYRKGQKAGWKKEFSEAHRRLFAELAGDLLIRLGYEPNDDWVQAESLASA
jgi:Sulfotransferase domain